MSYFLLKKVGIFISTFFAITLISFSVIRLIPGDPVLLMGGERGISKETYQRIEKAWGFDRPLPVQYAKFVGNVVQGNLGTSMITQRSVWEEFADRFPATLELTFAATLWAIIFGIPIGIIAALKKNSIFDYFAMAGSLIGFSMPIFWWGLIVILIFSVSLDLTPISGRIGLIYDIPTVTGFMLIDTLLSEEGFSAFKDAVMHLILPSLVLGTIPLGVVTRMTRSSMLEVIGEDYIRTAKAKGISPFRIVMLHALRNALIPVITVIGLTFGMLLTGAILTESIFSWPGIGKWIVHSVEARDYPVIQGGLLIIASLIIGVNLTVDLLYAVVNPKMR